MNEIEQLKYIPQELKYNGLWCCWRFVPNIDKSTGKTVVDKKTGEVEYIKKPFNVLTGYGAKSNDEKTFVTYPELLKHIHEYYSVDDNGKQRGGIGLGVFRGYSAIDIDHCVDSNGNLSDLAKDIIDFTQSYTEYSPSKTGIRIIFKTNVDIDKSLYYINNQDLGLEIYISGKTNKFVTITGNRINDVYTDIKDIDLSYVLNKYMRRDGFSIQKVLKKDAKLNELWNNTAPGSHNNENELDQALCCKLAYYLKNDAVEIDRYFRASPYYASKDDLHKAKWNRDDYRVDTINNAINLVGVSVNNITKKIYDLNDTGNARRFVDRFGNDLKYNVDNNIWMLWNGAYWQVDIKDYVKNYVEILAEEMMFEANNETDLNVKTKMLKNIDHIYSTGGKDALLKEAKHVINIPITNEELDRQQYLLCCRNTIFNLETGEMQEPLRSDNISQSTSCQIDMVNKPTRFIQFLNEIFNGDNEVIHYVHKAFGYSITDSAREQCMFILHGDGNNGKSLLLDVIKTTLGSYGITSKPQLLTEQKFSGSNSEEIARLKGKRFIAVEEIKEGDRLDEQLVKSLTSGIGNQVARFLYGNSFEFPVKGKIWMATNYEPVIKGVDKGIWRRIRKIPVTTDFTGKEDKDLRDKLLRECPQILGWLIEGYKLYQKEGLIAPAIVDRATQEYKENMDIVEKWSKEYCEFKSDYFAKSSVLYDNFAIYCQKETGYKMPITAFGRNMTKKFTKKCYNGCNVYIGIRLKRDAEDLSKKVAYDNIKVEENI